MLTLAMILHDWNLEKKMQLIQSAYDALPAGGAFVVIENLMPVVASGQSSDLTN